MRNEVAGKCSRAEALAIRLELLQFAYTRSTRYLTRQSCFLCPSHFESPEAFYEAGKATLSRGLSHVQARPRSRGPEALVAFSVPGSATACPPFSIRRRSTAHQCSAESFNCLVIAAGRSWESVSGCRRVSPLETRALLPRSVSESPQGDVSQKPELSSPRALSIRATDHAVTDRRGIIRVKQEC